MSPRGGFVSTRAKERTGPTFTFSEAALAGLAPDGGLFVPTPWPRLEDGTGPSWLGQSFPQFATVFLIPFFEGDPLEGAVGELCADAFDFEVPLRTLRPGLKVLELFHGPTAAFKDFGARFLARVLSQARQTLPGEPPIRVLVATSGDTGAAVAAAIHQVDGLEVGVLFPKGGVAPRQERQLTCWDGNVRSFAVRGTFDDCQAMTKQIFADRDWPASGRLTSANSINIGRLLPQAAYAAFAAARYAAEVGAPPDLLIPSGNLGDAVAAFWARHLGFPIGRIVLVTNANTVVPDWYRTGRWDPRRSVRTLANAMDVGDPSNMERLLALYPERPALLDGSDAVSVSDATIEQSIARVDREWGYVVCPHTATALHVAMDRSAPHQIVYATAHPAKFDEIVEPIIGRSVPVPPALAELLGRPTRVTEVEASAGAVKRVWP